MANLGYATIGSNNLDTSKDFYDPLMARIGLEPVFEHPSGGRIYGRGGRIEFAVLGTFDGRPASCGNGSMVGFDCSSREEVAAFHALAISLGATDEGAPGERAPGVYFAYFRDPDGNKLCGYKID